MELSKRYKCQVLQLDDKVKRVYKKYITGRVKRVKKSDQSTIGSDDTFSDDDSIVEEAPKNVLIKTSTPKN